MGAPPQIVKTFCVGVDPAHTLQICSPWTQMTERKSQGLGHNKDQRGHCHGPPVNYIRMNQRQLLHRHQDSQWCHFEEINWYPKGQFKHPKAQVQPQLCDLLLNLCVHNWTDAEILWRKNIFEIWALALWKMVEFCQHSHVLTISHVFTMYQVLDCQPHVWVDPLPCCAEDPWFPAKQTASNSTQELLTEANAPDWKNFMNVFFVCLLFQWDRYLL